MNFQCWLFVGESYNTDTTNLFVAMLILPSGKWAKYMPDQNTEAQQSGLDKLKQCATSIGQVIMN